MELALNGNFNGLSFDELFEIDGGSIFNSVCKSITAFCIGAIVSAAVGGGPQGAIVGAIVYGIVDDTWDKVFP